MLQAYSPPHFCLLHDPNGKKSCSPPTCFPGPAPTSPGPAPSVSPAPPPCPRPRPHVPRPRPASHLVEVQLRLLEVLLVLLQELLVLLLDDQVLQRLRALGQRRRLRAAQRAVLPQLVHRGRHALRPHQGLRVQGQRAQACKVAVWREHGEGRSRREGGGLVSD